MSESDKIQAIVDRLLEQAEVELGKSLGIRRSKPSLADITRQVWFSLEDEQHTIAPDEMPLVRERVRGRLDVLTADGDVRIEPEGPPRRPTPDQTHEGLAAPAERVRIVDERIAELAHELRVLDAFGLDDQAIQGLVKAEDHQAVCQRFAAAREHVGLRTLEPALHSYQRAIGAFSTEKRTGWSKEAKREMVSRLNSAAESLSAYFDVDGHVGRLVVGTGRAEGLGTFQIRERVAESGGRSLHGLGQSLPLLSLRPAT